MHMEMLYHYLKFKFLGVHILNIDPSPAMVHSYGEIVPLYEVEFLRIHSLHIALQPNGELVPLCKVH